MSSIPFGIEPKELEEIMNKYKSRSKACEDLIYLKKKNISEILSQIKTDTKKGISSLQYREEFFGSNKMYIEPLKNYCSFVWEALKDLMIIILIIAAIVSIILCMTISSSYKDDWIDGLSIVIVILIVVLVNSITQYSKEKKFHKLIKSQNTEMKYKLFRNGLPETYSCEEILVGDLININYGDIIAADILLIEGNEIKMDESLITGESNAMRKEIFEKCLEYLDRKEEIIPSPLILSGTKCIEGNGKGIVIAVGEHSQKGKIKKTVENAMASNKKTPLQIKLDKIAKIIGYMGIFIGLVGFIVFFIRYLIQFLKEKKKYDIKKKENIQVTNPEKIFYSELINILMLTITIIVLAVPEGLPLTVTLSLAFSINRLIEHNNFIRKMHACETMGGANYICTDKTGTLTKNEMSVHKILTGNNIYNLNQNIEINNNIDLIDEKFDKNVFSQKIREEPNTIFKNENYWNLIKISISLNVDCVIKKLDRPNENGDLEICETKNKTDKTFINFLHRFKSTISLEREKFLNDANTYKQFPFDSTKRRMTTFIQNSNFPTGYRLFTKGAGDFALQYCNSYINPDTGEEELLNQSVYLHLKKEINEFNKNRLRTLFVAYKDISMEEYNNPEKKNSQGKLIDQYNLVFVSIFGIRDSLKNGVKEAVKNCKEASVNLIMVTGDNIITATTIAKDCGILEDEIDINNLEVDEIEQNPEKMNDSNLGKKDEYIQKLINDRPYALTGNSFYNIIGGLYCENCKEDTNSCNCPKTEYEAKKRSQKEKNEIKKIKNDKVRDMNKFIKITERLKVLARSQPLHKYALVIGLKELNNVVAVTGDGTNDAPALSKSDIGFSMFSGTDIAKEASDIIILDNNFSSIVIAIIYGRNILDNIRKFLQFQLSVNLCACALVFIAACIGNRTPLTPVQILWVNLIMDSFGSLALATEPPYSDLLKREPTKKNEFIINGKMAKHIIFQSVILLVLLLLLYNYAPEFIKEDNLKRLAENKLIKYCFENYPGKNVEFIISGMESKWNKGNYNKTNFSLCGEYSTKQTLNLAYDQYLYSNSSTTHMTIIFNTFVFFTLFNQINCRIIDDSFNIFSRINKSILFIIIISMEICLQIMIIFFGSSALDIVDQGLTGTQWGISLGFSAITFIISIIGKLIPLDYYLDKFLSVEQEIPNFDPVAPKLNQLKDIIIGVDEKDIPNGEEEDEEEDIISEKINLDMLKYDFNNVEKPKQNGGSQISLENYNFQYSNNLKDKETEGGRENIIQNSEDEIKNIIEETSKRYKITDFGENFMNLPENYSTDDEDEYKFINIINEQNDSYELVVNTEIIKVYAKIVS